MQSNQPAEPVVMPSRAKSCRCTAGVGRRAEYLAQACRRVVICFQAAKGRASGLQAAAAIASSCSFGGRTADSLVIVSTAR